MKKNSGDRRNRKTEAVIEKAFFELAAKKDINKITVKELTDLADMNRGTFYLHYIDILDLQDKLEDKVIAELCGYASVDFIAAAKERQVLQITHILEYIRENVVVFKAFIYSNRSMKFMDKLVVALEEKIFPDISLKMKEHGQEFRRLVSTFFVNGAAALIRDWLTRENKTSPAELGAVIDTIVCTSLTSFASLDR